MSTFVGARGGRVQPVAPVARQGLAVDLDEVLVAHLEGLIEFYRSETGIPLSVYDFYSYRFWEVWGGERLRAIELVRRFYESEQFAGLLPAPGAVDAVERLRRMFDLHVVTARPACIAMATRRWLVEHFGGAAITDVVCTNAWPLPGERAARSKAEVCRSRGINTIVEDSLEHVGECCRSGMRAVLLDKPWNRGPTPPGAARVTSWEEAVGLLEPMASATGNAHSGGCRRNRHAVPATGP
jgi:hypothetical protein